MRLRNFAGWAIVALLALGGGVLAQGGAVAYGQSVTGSLSAQSPLAFYTFQGQAGDLVTVQVVALSPEVDLNITVLSPVQQQLAASSSDPFSAFSGDARLTAELPQTGTYSLLLGDLTGGGGDFLLRISAQQAASAAQALLPDASVQLDFAAGGPPQVVSVTTGLDGPANLRVTGIDGFMFSVEVRRQTGDTLAYFSGAPDVALSLPPNGVYIITIAALGQTSGAVIITVGKDSLPDVGAPPAPAIPAPAETPEVTDPGEACLVTASSQQGVNIRSGPGTEFIVVGQLIPGQALIVVGVSGEWYAVQLAGSLGWVAQAVVATQGACDALPQIDGPNTPVTEAPQPPDAPSPTPSFTPSPTQPGAPPPTFTYTPSPTEVGVQQQPTATFTPSYTPTSPQPTATFTPSYTPTTPPAPAVAPEDARFNNPLNIPLDSTASVTDFVSYPGGDTEDRVRYDITGMNNNSSLPGGRARLILAVSCFGTGTNNIQFFTNGQTYSCGQTIVDREVTADSRTGSVVITAVGGENTYVQWVLTGTATRVN